MKLTLPDASVCESPTAEDIAAAVAQRPRKSDWMLSLDAAGKVLQASIVDGEVSLVVDDEAKLLGMMIPQKSRALDAIDEALLESVFASYAASDGRWRQLCHFSTPEDRQRAAKLPWSATLLINLVLLIAIVAVIPDKFLPDFIPSKLRGMDMLLGLFPVTVAWGVTWGVALLLDQKMSIFRQMVSWARARATILQSEIVSEQITNTNATGHSNVSRTTVITVYSARIAYEYAVVFKRYFSTAVGLSDGTKDSDESVARTIVERYPVGAEVPVFYDPKHASRSALERDMPKMSGNFGLLVGAGVVMFSLTLWLIVAFVQGSL